MSIRNDVLGLEMHSLDEMEYFQGSLKDLSKENFEKAWKSMSELGFSEPFTLWKKPGCSKFPILNGHQRFRVLSKKAEQGETLPLTFPCIMVSAESEEVARKKVLALTSQYGEITKDGLYEFLHVSNVDVSFLQETLRFPEIDFKHFDIEYYEPEPNKEEKKKKSFECPACGYST